MTPRTDRAVILVRAVVHEVRAERLTFMAGSIAYHAFVSLLPLLVLLLAVVASVGDASLTEGFFELTRAVLTEGTADILVSELRATSPEVGVFGAVVLVWGTLRIFRGLDTAFSDIYESEAENTFGDQVSDGLLVLVVFGLAVVVGLAVESVLPLDGDGLAFWLARRVVLVVGLVLALYPIYYVFPDEDVSLLEVAPGVLVAAVGLTVFESLFSLYVTFRGPGESLVASILVLLTWLYFSGLVLLLGAAVNAVLSNRSRDVNVRPLLGGVDPGEARRAPSRTAVVGPLATLEERLADASDVTVVVDGEEINLPVPDRVRTDTETSRLLPGGLVSLELGWSPRETED
jgi:membrane protein